MQPTRRRLFRLVLLTLGAWAFVTLGRPTRPAPVEREEPLPAPEPSTVPGWASSPARPSRRPVSRRLAASFAFAVLFFAGASFSAIAGDGVTRLLEGDLVAEAAEEPAEAEGSAAEADPAVAPEPAPEPEPAPGPEQAPAPELEAGPEPQPAPEPALEPEPEHHAAEAAEAEPAAAPEQTSDPFAVDVAAETAGLPKATHPAPAPGVTPAAPERQPARAPAARPRPAAPAPSPQVEAEAHAHAGEPTVWLNRVLPDPTPPSLRLAPELAQRLQQTARRHGLDWAYLLAVLRADGRRVTVPARLPTLAETASRLARLNAAEDPWGAALAVHGRTPAADRAVALTRYYRAVGVGALVRGLEAEKAALGRRILADDRVWIYAGGRDDVARGRTDVRVLALIAYLAESYGQVTVSSLVSGRRSLYARPGVVSAHVYGHAVDIAALGGKPILGNSQPGGLTERAVRDILLLPREVLPRQLISLLGLGGPSFPLGDHGDHIHVGY